ncbi:hypothetical protein [Paraglaciecola arctica]|uniref:hypothetical protein n=1 Tax=Paraglaciecola arctica TaxID=1128911 RepID=UPI001C077E63|nr:hypothetical protein [Paraglaciecola arctica]MBU3004272.1 hypothetical protein [Paraglaciecola arctica]
METNNVTQIIVSFLESIIWITLTLGTVILVLKSVGLLPKKIKDKLEKNEANDIKELFFKLNITPAFYISNMRSLTLAYLSKKESSLEDKEIIKTIKKLVKERTFKSNMAWVTDTNSYHLKQYTDLQGLTFNPEINKQLANFIEKLISKRLISCISSDSPVEFDCIVVHENAAPFLGYEVSSRMNLPLIYVKSITHDKHSDIILHGQEVSEDRKSFTFSDKKLSKAIFIADFLMLGPHLDEARSYLSNFGVELTEVFLLVHKDIEGSREKISGKGFNLNFWVSESV